MAKIAIYGKGGIGKSTIAANVSAALAKRGKRVLQVGCDPKHDSTRLLLGGERPGTVLDYLKVTSPDRCRLSGIVRPGVFGIDCIEAGGPEPGVGCAGRGILTTFELIDRLGIADQRYDATVYDVLGDVVCGGFAVPIRREYAEKVYIVSSGEFMSIYAANNILRGLKNYDQNREGRVGGIIFNSRDLGEEDERVRRFLEAVGLPLAASFPRSDLFSLCEDEGRCLVEAYPDSELAGRFFDLAELIENQSELYPASPLSDEELEERILGRKGRALSLLALPPAAPSPPGEAAPAPGIFSKSMVAREPLMGCAFNGAMSITTQISGCVSIAHGPRSCAHIAYQTITSTPRRLLLERGIVLPYTSAPPLVSSDMGERVMIFGGIEELRAGIKAVKSRGEGRAGKRVLFVLSTCPAGIIGDNVNRVLDMEDEDTNIVPIRTDGNIQGDFLQGILIAYFETARALIDRNVEAVDDTVNIVAEKAETYALYDSFAAVKEILDRFGIHVNCHFIRETSLEDIRNFKRGKLNLLAWGDYMGRSIREFLEKEYDAEFFDEPFPVGFSAASRWTRRLGERFHRTEEQIQAVLSGYRERYRAEIERIRPKLQGKRVMIISVTQNIDWALQTALDAGMEIAFVGILSFSQENLFTTELEDSIGELVTDYQADRRNADIARVKPDLLLSTFPSAEDLGPVYQDTISYSPEAGFWSGLVQARRWAEIFNMNLLEGWKKDECFFRKHYA
ncbi:MAG: AAA family ATPase [Spirochaetaceae bacterium]|jgi:nitrogenase iron protein|nr:AAA family ATPase [Spirochaetaceae bacterium]